MLAWLYTKYPIQSRQTLRAEFPHTLIFVFAVSMPSTIFDITYPRRSSAEIHLQMDVSKIQI